MIRAAAIARNNSSALDLIDTYDPATPTGLQLMAKSPEELTWALRHLETLASPSSSSVSPSVQRPHFKNIRAVDLNLGCPSPDVINIGAGPALLKRRARLASMFEALSVFRQSNSLGVDAVGCKIRLGLNAQEQDRKVYLGVVEAANLAGLDYLVVHARHAKQRSRDPPSWGAIEEIKSIARMPVIGNGDVFSGRHAEDMQRQTGCDGVMVARAAIVNPWMFRQFRVDSVNNSRSDSTSGADCTGGCSSSSSSSDISSRNSSSEPTLEEVEAAEREYVVWSRMFLTKKKYSDFHAWNFARLKVAAREGKWDTLTTGTGGGGGGAIYPKNIHFG